MDSKKSNKIREIVRLQQILKKWKKLANASKNTTTTTSTVATTTAAISTNASTSTSGNGSSRSMKFLKRTLSFSDVSGAHQNQTDVVPKGFLAICVGKELKRFIIPTEYLGHQAFRILLQEAEDEFGFQQEGVLKIPCEVRLFEKILKMVEEKREVFFLNNEFGLFINNNNNNNNAEKDMIGFCSSPSDCELTPSHHLQMCR